MKFTFQEQGFSFHNDTAMRIADSTVYALYRLPHGSLQRAQLTPACCQVEQASLHDVHGAGQRVTLTQQQGRGLNLRFTLQHYPHHPFLLFRLSVTNLSPAAIHLHELVLLEVAPGQLTTGAPDAGLGFFKVGWHSWAYSGLRTGTAREPHTLFSRLSRTQYTNPITPLPERPGEFTSEGWALLAGEREALLVGLASQADQFGQVSACCRPGALSLRLATQADEVLLASGASFDSEWGYLQILPLPDPDPARDYLCVVARQMAARTHLTPQPQWTHWYHFYQSITAHQFIANLDAITSVRAQVPFQVIQLDDGYQTAWGEWTTANAKFPDGLQHLSERIRSAGFTPGLWLAPFVIQPGSWVDREHPDWLLHNAKGRLVNAGYFYQFFGRALDATHPQVQEHLHTLVETLTRQWGYRLLKLDFLYAGALPGQRYDAHLTRAQALRRGLEIIRQAAGDETFLLGCGCPFGSAIGLVDGMRISPDTAPSWEPWFDWAPWATRLLKREPSPPALRNSLRNTLNLSCLHRRWWWNDPDCMLVRAQDTRLSEAEVRSRVTLTGLSGGMLVDSDDLTRLPAERLELLSLLTPILSPGGQPLDLLQRDMPELYHLPMHGAAGSWHLVSLFNWQDCPAGKRLSLAQLGIPSGRPVYVFDFWAQRLWQTVERELFFPEIPAHGCRLLRLCPLDVTDPSRPLLLGDTLHITQGLEISDWRADPQHLELSIMELGRVAHGSFWLKLPSRQAKATCNGESLNLIAQGEDIYRLPLNFSGLTFVELLLSGS